VAGYWHKGNWIKLDNPNGNYDSLAKSIVIDGDDIYAGGHCSTDSVYVAGFWKNGTWNKLNNPYGTHSASVCSVVIKK